MMSDLLQVVSNDFMFEIIVLKRLNVTMLQIASDVLLYEIDGWFIVFVCGKYSL